MLYQHIPKTQQNLTFLCLHCIKTLHKAPRHTIYRGGLRGGLKMARETNRLSATGAKSAPVGKHADGGGLWLVKRADGGAQWVLRVTAHGRRREMGLGAYPDVSLKEARGAADAARAVVCKGQDPIKERERARRAAARNIHMLADIALDAFESRKAELKGDGKAGRWYSPLELHVLPKLGKVPVADIDQKDIRDTLAPIWHSKAVTARKAMNRLSIVMRHAAALGLDVDLQATDKAVALLGKQRHTAKNVPAMNWRDVPAFYQSLGGSVTELALRLLILTAVRSGPLRMMHVDQIDGDIWTIPAEAMKGRLSQSICTQRIDAALAATPRLVSDDPLLQGVIAVQSDRSKIPDDVLDFCAEIYPEDDDHDDHYFRR